MALQEHVEIVIQGSSAMADWRRGHPQTRLDLENANLAGCNLSGCDLSSSLLSGADLSDCELVDADLEHADLRHSSLAGANLTGATGIEIEMLAGCDLRATQLDKHLASRVGRLPDGLHEATNYTRHLFGWMLAVCFFCWLSIGATRDVDLIVNRGRLVLPIFDVAFPIGTFYWLAPPLLIGMYLYFQIYLQRQWDVLGGQPAVTFDGTPLDRRVHGWIVLGLVRRHFTRLCDRPPRFRWQSVLCSLLVWWAVPLTVLAFWWRYARRHDLVGAIWLLLMAATAVHLALESIAAARDTLQGRRHPTLRWLQHGATALLVVVLWTLNMWAINAHGRTPLLDANLVNDNLSTPPSDWSALTIELPDSRQDPFDFSALSLASAMKGETLPQSRVLQWHGDPLTNLAEAEMVERTSRRLYRHVRGAQLLDVNLKGGNLIGAFLARANLSGSNLRSANLSSADVGWARLSDAVLSHVSMFNATLLGADLSRSDLSHGWFSHSTFIGANLSGAVLHGAYLTHTDFCRANLRGSVMTNANCSFARFTGANLEGASLGRASLVGADLRGVVGLQKSQLERAVIDARTLLPDFDAAGVSIPIEPESIAQLPRRLGASGPLHENK